MADPDVERRCVAASLSCFGIELTVDKEVPANVIFDTIPTLLSDNAHLYSFLKPAKLDMPHIDILRGGRMDRQYSVSVFCRDADPKGSCILRVCIMKSNTSLHCVAVKCGMLIDPADMKWGELSVWNFVDLDIGMIEAGYKINWK